MCPISNGDISNDLDGPLTRFQGHVISEVKYLTDKVTVAQDTNYISGHTG